MATIKLINEVDRQNASGGMAIPIREIEIEALVDTGATMLCLPTEAAEALGLASVGTSHVKVADGRKLPVPRVGPIRLEIFGRDCIVEAIVLGPGTTPLPGQIPLEALDLVVDPKSRDVYPNPEHPEGALLDVLVA